jgi:hypothetical protein
VPWSGRQGRWARNGCVEDDATGSDDDGEKAAALKVDTTLRLGVENKAHGTSEMPVWRPLFSATDRNQQALTMRVSNLAKYVEALEEN